MSQMLRLIHSSGLYDPDVVVAQLFLPDEMNRNHGAAALLAQKGDCLTLTRNHVVVAIKTIPFSGFYSVDYSSEGNIRMYLLATHNGKLDDLRCPFYRKLHDISDEDYNEIMGLI